MLTVGSRYGVPVWGQRLYCEGNAQNKHPVRRDNGIVLSKDHDFKPISSCIEISKDVLKRSIAAGRTDFNQLYLKFNFNEWPGQNYLP